MLVNMLEYDYAYLRCVFLCAIDRNWCRQYPQSQHFYEIDPYGAGKRISGEYSIG